MVYFTVTLKQKPLFGLYVKTETCVNAKMEDKYFSFISTKYVLKNILLQAIMSAHAS
jgi:hypothetical protein